MTREEYVAHLLRTAARLDAEADEALECARRMTPYQELTWHVNRRGIVKELVPAMRKAAASTRQAARLAG